MTNLQLHKKAVELLEQINLNSSSIAKIKGQLVDLEKDPSLTRGYKEMFIKQFQELLNDVRETKKINVDSYTQIMRQLVEPIIES